MEHTHLKNLKRLEMLFGVVVSGHALVFLVAVNEEAARPTPYKKSV